MANFDPVGGRGLRLVTTSSQGGELSKTKVTAIKHGGCPLPCSIIDSVCRFNSGPFILSNYRKHRFLTESLSRPALIQENGFDFLSAIDLKWKAYWIGFTVETFFCEKRNSIQVDTEYTSIVKIMFLYA